MVSLLAARASRTTSPVRQRSAHAQSRGHPRAPCQCQEVKRGRGKEEEAGSGRCVGCGLARKGRPRRRADPVVRAIMDPAEAVLQEKALKFMVRRWCGQETSGGGSAGASLILGLGHPLTAGGGSGTGAKTSGEAEGGTGPELGGGGGRVQRGPWGGGSSSAILWKRGQVTAGAHSRWGLRAARGAPEGKGRGDSY